MGLQEGKHLNPALGEEEQQHKGIMAENVREQQWREEKQFTKSTSQQTAAFWRSCYVTRGNKY